MEKGEADRLPQRTENAKAAALLPIDKRAAA